MLCRVLHPSYPATKQLLAVLSLEPLVAVVLDHVEVFTLRNRVNQSGRKEMFYLTTHSTHFIYSYMVSDIWLRTILIVRKETCCHHIGYSYRLTARVLLYAPSHRLDSTYHCLCYTSHGALAGMREWIRDNINWHWWYHIPGLTWTDFKQALTILPPHFLFPTPLLFPVLYLFFLFIYAA